MAKHSILPAGFVYLHAVVPSILQDMKYFTTDNFIGRPIAGYLAPVCIVSSAVANALVTVQQKLVKDELSLKIFDGYRPQQATEDFIVWSHDHRDQKMKREYYPHVAKEDFFKLGYVAERSAHTRGAAVDVTIVKFSATGQPSELPMGTRFDLMDDLSQPLSPRIQGEAHHNRMLLRELMLAAGFIPYEKEWWHFTLLDEPFPETYFDFPIL